MDSLVVSALQDVGGYAISHQNNLELHLGCHTCWLSYFTLVYLWCGRTVGRSVGVRSRDYQIFSDGWFTTFSYPWCSAARASRERDPLLVVVVVFPSEVNTHLATVNYKRDRLYGESLRYKTIKWENAFKRLTPCLKKRSETWYFGCHFRVKL